MAFAAAILGWAAVAVGQTQQWVKQESWPGVNAMDEMTGVVYWQDNAPSTPVRYVYVTGYLTVNQTTGATVFATFRYEVDNPAAFTFSAYFPAPAGATGVNKAAAITIHPVTGDVIVTGESDAGGNGRNYVTIKYDKALNPSAPPPFQKWTTTGLGDGVRHFDNANITNGNDQARDVEIDADGYVYVTGSSEGLTGGVSKNYDIVTIKYDPDGTLSSTWSGSDIAPYTDGVRRYNNGPTVNGSDTAVALKLAYVVETGEGGAGWWCYVAGTSYGGPSSGGGTEHDFITLGYDADAVCSAQRAPRRSARHDAAGLDDVATGMAYGQWATGGVVGVTGWSVFPDPTSLTGGGSASSAFGPSGGGAAAGPGGPAPTTVDYATVAYHLAGIPQGPGLCATEAPAWTPAARYFSGPGGAYGSDDYAAAITYAPGPIPAGPGLLWVTGKARNGVGYDAGTVLYNADLGVQLCSHLFGGSTGYQAQGHDVAADPFGRVWIAGRTMTMDLTLTGTLTIHYVDASNPTCGIAAGWPRIYQNGTGLGLDSAARLTTTDGLSGPDVFPVGTTYQTGSGQNGLIIRYSIP